MRAHALLVLSCLCVVGCPKDKGAPTGGATSTSASASASMTVTGPIKVVVTPPTASTSAAPKPAVPRKKPEGPTRAIAGVDVPAWSKPSMDKPTCSLAESQKKTLMKLMAGEGASYDDGSADPFALVDDLAKDCSSASALVSHAIATGGATRLTAKKSVEASRWLARAVAVDPSNSLARWDLVRALAADGKKEDAAWNLEQLVAAAKGGDPRGLYFARLAKTDESVASLKEDAGFKKALEAATAHEATLADKCEGAKVPVSDGKGKSQCLQLCSTFGATSGCADQTVCLGAGAFGSAFVPYCKSADAKCPQGEREGLVWVDGVGAGPTDCLHSCTADTDCKNGKKCSGLGGVPTLYGLMWAPACAAPK